MEDIRSGASAAQSKKLHKLYIYFLNLYLTVLHGAPATVTPTSQRLPHPFTVWLAAESEVIVMPLARAHAELFCQQQQKQQQQQ